jgi:hypothetical protein
MIAAFALSIQACANRNTGMDSNRGDDTTNRPIDTTNRNPDTTNMKRTNG